MQKIQPIVQLTSIARTKLVEVLNEQKAAESYLRIDVYQSGGCACSGGYKYGMSLEQKPKQNDVVEDVEGLKILTDQSNVEFLRGSKIDYMDTLQKRGFKIENPNVEAEGCGCGGH